MKSTRANTGREREVGAFTRVLADYCESCGMPGCSERGHGWAFGRFMGRCRNWCSPWAARSRVCRDEDIDHDDYDDYDDRGDYEYDDAPRSAAGCDCYDDCA